MSSGLRRWVQGWLMGSLVVAPLAGLAQDKPRASGVIEEIVVTATKREVSVREIPASITALKGEDLEALGVQGVQDIVKLTPGVNFTDNGSEPERVTVRGIAADSNGNATTGIFIGDVPFTDPYLPRVSLDPNPFDLATVEVLKGPQGTLFGGSGLNGAIRYVPAEPEMGQWQGKYSVQHTTVSRGNSGSMLGGAVNVPLFSKDDLALRLTGFERDAPGWVDELSRGRKDVNTIDQSGLRAQLRWQPDGAWDLLASWIEQDTLLLGFPYVDAFDGNLERSNTPAENFKETSYSIASLRARRSFDSFEITSVTAQLVKRWDISVDVSRLAGPDNPPQAIEITGFNGSTARIQELRANSINSSGRWDWFGGLFVQQSDGVDQLDLISSAASLPFVPPGFGLLPGSSGVVTEDGSPNAGRVEADITLTELAAFGELIWRPRTDLELTLGTRLYDLKSDGYVRTSGALYGLGDPDGGTERTNQRVVKNAGMSPKFAAKWDFSDPLMFYASVSRGFRFGGQQRQGSSATTSVPEEFKSDTLWNYEFGLRSQWFNDTLVADLTGFWIDWTNPQLQQASADMLITYIDNVGGALSRGAEFALRWQSPIEGLRLGTAGAWVTTRTTQDFTTGSGVFVPEGSPWPLSPRWQLASTLTLARQVGHQTLNASLVHTYMDRAVVNLGDPTEVFGFGQLDFQLNWSLPRPNLPTVGLVVNNLFDKRGVVGAFDGAFTDVTYIRPLTVTLRLAGEFG